VQNKQDLNSFALQMFNKKLVEVKSTTFLGRGNGGTTVIGVKKAGQIVRELIDLEL